jgi:two-component system sensor histidine kinase and response regulator WspE
MPEMNGIELIKNLRADPNYARLPIVISSSKDREQDRLLGLDAGADYYLVKSDLLGDTLPDAIHQLIGSA